MESIKLEKPKSWKAEWEFLTFDEIIESEIAGAKKETAEEIAEVLDDSQREDGNYHYQWIIDWIKEKYL